MHAVSSAQSQPGALVGLWMSRSTDPAGLTGDLQVTHTGSRWQAHLANSNALATPSGNELRFSFGADNGEFRAATPSSSGALSGFWIQPGYASPLVLQRTGPGTWHGTVHPLQVPFTLYLRVFRNANGDVLGAFRNPERNSQGGAQQFHVALSGKQVEFTAQHTPQSKPIKIDATLENGDRLTLPWQYVGKTLSLTRVSGDQGANFYPRTPGTDPYAYRVPAKTNDGWTTASAKAVGFDESALARVVQGIIDGDPSNTRPRLIHSLLISRHGKLVLEEYFFGYGPSDTHDLRSAGKTFASVMLGAVMQRGTPIGPQTHVYDELQAMGPFAHADPRKAQITVANLMTHTSGLACDDNDDNSPGNEDTMQSQNAQPNWWKYTLDLPMVHDPGTRYAYCSGGMNLVGAVLTTATHQWLPKLFDDTVARPLQFGPYYWNLMPTGEGYLGGGAYVRPRDLLKVGQMYLNGGTWNGRRIVSPAWIADSTAAREPVTEQTTGIDAAQFTDYYIPGFSDGYAWHVSQVEAGGKTYREYQASGNGGQLLYVVPQLDLAVVITAGNYGQGGIWNRFRDDILANGIIPAIQR
jgi:CubicO group peptidase (beta-lactamase class C family)